MEGLDSQIKGFLFFAGSLMRWPAQKPSQFLYFHGYILVIYALHAVTDLGLILVLGAMGPLCLAVSRGLPVDCLDYKAAMAREFGDNSLSI